MESASVPEEPNVSAFVSVAEDEGADGVRLDGGGSESGGGGGDVGGSEASGGCDSDEVIAAVY